MPDLRQVIERTGKIRHWGISGPRSHKSASHADLARKLAELEKRYDAQFKVVFDAIRQLMAPPEKARCSIGFRVEETGMFYRTRRCR